MRATAETWTIYFPQRQPDSAYIAIGRYIRDNYIPPEAMILSGMN